MAPAFDTPRRRFARRRFAAVFSGCLSADAPPRRCQQIRRRHTLLMMLRRR